MMTGLSGFQSTLSIQKETALYQRYKGIQKISIHSFNTERDGHSVLYRDNGYYFNPLFQYRKRQNHRNSKRSDEYFNPLFQYRKRPLFLANLLYHLNFNPLFQYRKRRSPCLRYARKALFQSTLSIQKETLNIVAPVQYEDFNPLFQYRKRLTSNPTLRKVRYFNPLFQYRKRLRKLMNNY